MSDEEKQAHSLIANSILLAVVKEFRMPIYAGVGFCLAQLIGFFCIGVHDHFLLQNLEEVQSKEIKPKVDSMWDDHWAWNSQKKNP